MFNLCKMNMKTIINNSAFKFTVIVRPMFFTLLFYYSYKMSGKLNIASVIINSSAMSLWSSVCVSSLFDLEREKNIKTFLLIVAAPLSLLKFVVCKIIPNIICGSVSVLVSIIFISLLALSIPTGNDILIIIISMMLLMISYTIVALCIIPVLDIFDNTRNAVNFLEYPIYILTGMAFPLSMLPESLRLFSYLNPITWGIEISRKIVKGVLDESTLRIFIMFIFINLICVIIARVMFSLLEKRIKKSAKYGI